MIEQLEKPRRTWRIPIVIFAQVPPPEHGQSRMVKRTLDTLCADTECFDVRHVNARFSESLENIGESSVWKILLTFKYLAQAVRLRFLMHDPLLLYVPGPANWSPVVRDWILLAVLRLFYRRIVFHWHAIGHGEWAHGSQRLALEGPAWLDRCARAVSRFLLDEPYGSISVCRTSTQDAVSVASLRSLVVPNGIEDPCPDFDVVVAPIRREDARRITEEERPIFRILFLSHGTVEKGLLDAVRAIRSLLESSVPSWRFAVTFAGGVSEAARLQFESEIQQLKASSGSRLSLEFMDYVSGEEKHRCYIHHDIFLSPSRWESFGLTVLEAMAHGMRIVAAASDGVRGVLPEGYPYLAAVASPDMLASKLHQCCQDLVQSATPEAGTTLRRRFLDHFQLKYFSTHIAAAFDELSHEGSTESYAKKYWTLEDTKNFAEGTTLVTTPRAQIHLNVYLADQNPGHDRSFGISRMTQVVLEALQKSGEVHIHTVASRTSQQAPAEIGKSCILPWGTRGKTIRLLTDHLHPLFHNCGQEAALHYYPKGYLPLLHQFSKPSVVTIHDTIIQYDEDHYPHWRKPWEYSYWSWLLKHTLGNADRIMTVSESSKEQIISFMERHGIPPKPITVTYEPCTYESLPQPSKPAKENHVIHLASCEPHKQTARLVRWWRDAENAGKKLPTLHLIGSIPEESKPLLAGSQSITKRPFLDDSELQVAYQAARALILPSEIEGFGLPALEAYYLGTPVCFVKGTSVDEVLSVATRKGGFTLGEMETLGNALDEVLMMGANEVRECGLKLRQTYASDQVAKRMIAVFREVGAQSTKNAPFSNDDHG